MLTPAQAQISRTVAAWNPDSAKTWPAASSSLERVSSGITGGFDFTSGLAI
jgi:hypothetical protein